MNCRQSLNGFDFQHNGLLDQEVDPISGRQKNILKYHVNGALSFYGQSFGAKLCFKQSFICRLQ